jgi:hypothetical protein
MTALDEDEPPAELDGTLGELLGFVVGWLVGLGVEVEVGFGVGLVEGVPDGGGELAGVRLKVTACCLTEPSTPMARTSKLLVEVVISGLKQVWSVAALLKLN